MKIRIRKTISAWMILFLWTGIFMPAPQPSYAASNTMFNPSFSYNQETSKWDITWTPVDGTDTCSVTWHDPADGSVQRPDGPSDLPLVLEGGKNILSLSFLPDYIYDLNFSFKNDAGETISFHNKYNTMTDHETVFFLSDITFEGTSFNDSAVLGGLTDGDPRLFTNTDGTVIRILSGQDPKVSFRWRIPRIWDPTGGGTILPVTHEDVDLNRLESSSTPHVDIDYSYFHIQMNEVQDVITGKNYRTTVTDEDYRTAPDGSNEFVVRENGKTVSGLLPDGSLEPSANAFVSITLDQTDGILPGCEYEDVSIKLYFWNNAQDEQAISSRIVYGYESGTGFAVENKDNVFQGIEGRIDSVFTPMMYEISKVDIDKIEVRIYKIESKNYTELYYQVQDAGSIVDMLENSAQLSSGIKVPDASIPDSTGYGSVIVEIPLNQIGEHPQHYYRVVVTDGDSRTPLGSLAIDLRDLGNDTGKPPVPREIEVQPIYDGKQNVSYQNPTTPVSVRIPLTDLRISFEKPLIWRTQAWGNILAVDDENDFTFHILLNTYLNDDARIVETRVIGEEEVTIYAPVREKRVVVIGKDQLIEDPDDSSRLIYEMKGDDLFQNFENNTSLSFENNVDYDVNGNADYPDFLLPNTTYYMRMFSTRVRDNVSIDWTRRDESDFEEKISYISPVVSFTTYPSQEMPVPLPNLSLDADVEPEPDPVTGRIILNGISISFAKIMDDNDWMNYTNVTDGRRIVYDLYMSDSVDEDSFLLVDSLETSYPDDNPEVGLYTLVSRFPAESDGEALRPNTTYYFKAQAELYVNGEAEPFIFSDVTSVKSITTPKTDSGNLDDTETKPRTPVEFSIAENTEGEPELTDARATLNWLHAEQDVTYEMVCTTQKMDADAVLGDYNTDEYNVGDTDAPGFIRVYQNYLTNPSDRELHINVLNTPLENLGFRYNEENTRIAKFPVNLPFLKPNHLYWFSLRAVRNRGTDEEVCSNWVSIPVTTKMVAAPGFLEAVNDVQLGFAFQLSGGVPAENVKLMLKKGFQSDSAYAEISRARYSVVKDGNTYYCRLFDLEPDTWYDIQPFYLRNELKILYNNDTDTWSTTRSDPIRMKTRDTLNEIEVRFEGESLYEYLLEVRTDDDEDYITLEYYDEHEAQSDYGYTLADGTRLEFYREKTSVYVEDDLAGQYIYYAKISGARIKRSDGTYKRQPLLSNTRYYIKVWARNVEDSSHVGPVTIRTDFSQDDYDKGYLEDEIKALYESKADSLNQKLYFTVDEANKTTNRVLLKGTMISNLMRIAGKYGVTVDISKERPQTSLDLILIPCEILDTLQKENARLTIKLAQGELTLTRESFDLDALKQLTAVTSLKETMLEITVDRKVTGTVAPPKGYLYGSGVYDISMRSVAMKRTYAQINEIIYDILKEPNTAGPFKYGLFDRELAKLFEKKTTLTYKSQVDLKSILDGIMNTLEAELSLYLRDILDGGRGFSASVIQRKEVSVLPGGIKLKMLYSSNSGRMEPYVLLKGQTVWKEPSGMQAWVFPYALLTVKAPGQYAVFSAPQVSIPTADGGLNVEFQRLSHKYDLQKVFGSSALYPADFVTGDKAVLLFEVITGTENEVKGLSIPAKIKYYNLNGILAASTFQPNINREQAASMVVEIYACKTGISSEVMRPVIVPYIKNAAAMKDPFYHRLVIALDLGITALEPDKSYAGEKPATVEELLNEIITVLQLLGEW